VTENRSQIAVAGQQLFNVIRVYIYIYIFVEYVSPCGEDDLCICCFTSFGCHNMDLLHVTKLRGDTQSAPVSPGDGNPLSGVAEVDLPPHNMCGC